MRRPYIAHKASASDVAHRRDSCTAVRSIGTDRADADTPNPFTQSSRASRNVGSSSAGAHVRIDSARMLKLGALGSAALVLPLERTARAELQQANRLDPRACPPSGSCRFSVPKVAKPTQTVVTVPGTWIDPAHQHGADRSRRGRLLRVPHAAAEGADPARAPGDADLGLPRHRRRARRSTSSAGVPCSSGTTTTSPSSTPCCATARRRPRCTCTATRRSRSTTATRATPPLRPVQGLLVPVDSRMPATLWYHDHGVHHTASNAYMGLAALYPAPRRRRARLRAAAARRRTTSTATRTTSR